MLNNSFVSYKQKDPSKIKQKYFYDCLYQRDCSRAEREYIIERMFDGLEIMTKKEIKKLVDEYLDSDLSLRR